MWSDVYRKGLVYVHQLFDECQYKKDEQVLEEYGLTSLRFNSLKSAMPLELKEFFCTKPKQTFMPLAPHNYEDSLRGNFTRKVYTFLGDDVMLISKKFLKVGDQGIRS